jgi:hypothetical protein
MWRTDIDRYRARRTLSEVKRKLEEALRLSTGNGGARSPKDGVNGKTATHRHR